MPLFLLADTYLHRLRISWSFVNLFVADKCQSLKHLKHFTCTLDQHSLIMALAYQVKAASKFTTDHKQAYIKTTTMKHLNPLVTHMCSWASG